jgi:hypothetical protein
MPNKLDKTINLEGCSNGITDESDLRSMLLRWPQMAWYVHAKFHNVPQCDLKSILNHQNHTDCNNERKLISLINNIKSNPIK